MATNEHKAFQQATAHKQPRFPRADSRMPHLSRSAIHPAIPLQLQLNPQSVLAAQSLTGNRAVVQLLRQQHGQETQTASSTRLPEPLKTTMESLSGIDLSEVQVHHNSEKPAQLQALAYAQGNHIYLGAGQEQHLPHEAWHVVQQKQGRVKPTLQMQTGIAINNDPVLEKEATQWGEKALRHTPDLAPSLPYRQAVSDSQVVQRVLPLLIKNKAEKDIKAEKEKKEKKEKKERENKWLSDVNYGEHANLVIKNNNKSNVNVRRQIGAAFGKHEKLLNSLNWYSKKNKDISNYNKSPTSLIPCEFTSIYIYSRELYQEINKNLREGVVNEKLNDLVKILIEKIDSGIKKLRQLQDNVKNPVYRGVSDTSLENLNIGDIFTDKAFLSTSTSKKQALKFLGGENRFLMEIHGKSGVDISKISHYPTQKEVLFGTRKNFLIKQKISKNELDDKVVKSLDDKIMKLDETLKEKVLKELTLSSTIEKEIVSELKQIFSTVTNELGSLKKLLTTLVMEEKEEKEGIVIEGMD